MPAIYSDRLFASLLFGALLATACGGKDAAPAATNEPARQITLAPTPETQPALNDAPAKRDAAPAPAVRKPAPKKPAPEPSAPTTIVRELPPAAAPASAGPTAAAMGSIAAGTSFTVQPTARICTNTHKSGDRFTATLRETVTGSNGATIPAGSAVVFRVVESARSENSKDNIRLTYDVVAVKVGDDSYTAEAAVTRAAPIEGVRTQSTGDQAKKVGAGAAIGAIAGQILGKNTRSTVIGAVVGGAAGGAVAAGTADYDGCVPAEANITVTLGAPLKVKVVSARAPGF
jgi:hypothetical protein